MTGSANGRTGSVEPLVEASGGTFTSAVESTAPSSARAPLVQLTGTTPSAFDASTWSTWLSAANGPTFDQNSRGS